MKGRADLTPFSAGTPGVRCLVVEDHALVLQWLCALLHTLPDIRVVATAMSLAEASVLLEHDAFDLLVVDASLPDGDGEECVRIARGRWPDVCCVVLRDSVDGRRRRTPAPSSTAAVIHKRDTTTTFMRAVHGALTRLRGREHTTLDTWLFAPQQVMSRREYEIYCGIGRGLANKEIAATLGLSPQTVETHRKSVAKKLGTRGSDLIRKATIHVMIATPVLVT